ncbi:Membralin [Cinara cedri]|uniref:Membralin n=1 Tax=Cinara cedri TaxID=506608 RepID=A0A5E4MLZ7_9HEMI|nr:Membralin [Cinara cedri]
MDQHEIINMNGNLNTRLLMAVLMLLLLIYMHIYFIRSINGCLDFLKEALPNIDILRLETIQPDQRDYAELTGNIDQIFTLHESYSREMKARKLYDSEFMARSNRKIPPYDGSTPEECERKASISKYSFCHKKDFIGLDSIGAEMCFPNKYSNSSALQYYQNDFDINSNLYPNIILEYSSTFALLSLCPITRYETNVSVLYVPLEPFRSICFGGNIFIQHLLKAFNGYHHVLMHSIKTLLQEKDRGYVRNCITREYYLFMDHVPLIRSLIIPFFSMSLFSYLTLMVFRFLNNYVTNIIVSMAYLTELETLRNIYSTMLTLLAILGLKVLMNTFFQTDSFILIIMLMVWLSHQLSLLFFHHSMTRNYWLKFNYLYQFSFYVYYYRFNGQFGGLSLYVAWSFIEHSIVFFLQHYEIPHLVQHAIVYEAIIRRIQQ